MAKEYDILYGEANDVCKELKGVSEVAEFICTEGLKGDVEIFSEDFDRITDLEYREELIKVLIPMQRKLDGTDNT